MSDLDSKIQEILDKESIRELVYTFCRAADRHDNKLLRSLYHEDAYDDHGSFFKGKAMEFIDLLPEIQKSMGGGGDARDIDLMVNFWENKEETKLV